MGEHTEPKDPPEQEVKPSTVETDFVDEDKAAVVIQVLALLACSGNCATVIAFLLTTARFVLPQLFYRNQKSQNFVSLDLWRVCMNP